MTENIDRERFMMRAPCGACGSPVGRLVTKSGQNVVYCLCGKHAGYNAPKHETGDATRSVTTRDGFKPKVRARVLQRDGHRCLTCGARAVDGAILHVGHIVSVKTGEGAGLTVEQINHDENLIAQCEECNLGQGAEPMPLWVAVAVLRARISWRERGAK